MSVLSDPEERVPPDKAAWHSTGYITNRISQPYGWTGKHKDI